MPEDQSPSIEGGKIVLPVTLDLSEAQRQYAQMVEDFKRQTAAVLGERKGPEAATPTKPDVAKIAAPSDNAPAMRVIEAPSEGKAGLATNPYAATDRILLSILGQMQELVVVARSILDATESNTGGS